MSILRKAPYNAYHLPLRSIRQSCNLAQLSVVLILGTAAVQLKMTIWFAMPPKYLNIKMMSFRYEKLQQDAFQAFVPLRFAQDKEPGDNIASFP